MPVTDVPSAILAIRLSINDTATSHYAAPDNMEAQVDGIRKVFKLSNRNILSGNAFYVQDAAAPVTANPSDLLNGIAVMAAAPVSSLEWYYYYQDFIDAEIQQFLDYGLGEVGLGETDLAKIPQGLWTVVSHFASAEAALNRMNRFAESFNTAIEGETYDMADIYKAYKAAHDTHLKDAESKREEYYKKQGRRFQSYSNTKAPAYRPTGLFPRR